MSRINLLKQRIRDGKVVPFVGAGVSLAVKDRKTANLLFPSWRSLLQAAADQLDAEDEISRANVVRALLDVYDYMQAAKQAQVGLGHRLFQIVRDETNRLRQDAEERSLELAKLIWMLGSDLLITTNYDNVLEWACPNSDCKIILNRKKFELGEVMSGELLRPTVWHLHGHVDDVDSIILTPNGYEQLYSTEAKGSGDHYQAALTAIRSLLATKSLLFIGYGLGDDDLNRQFGDIAEMFKRDNSEHFVLLPESRIGALPTSLNSLIAPIPYKDHGDPLLELMRELVACVPTIPLVSPVDPPALLGPTKISYDTSNRPWSLPFRSKGDQVLGRDADLVKVRQALLGGRPTAIGQAVNFQGLGGLGKTQLAVEYAAKFGTKENYPNGVIWLTADQDIDAQLALLADKAQWVGPQSEEAIKRDVALQRVRSYSECLLIFDNVERVEDIEPYLPLPNANPHILITSRFAQEGFISVPLETLDAEASENLLFQEARRRPESAEEAAAAAEVAEMLGGLPLALELAGAFVQYRNLNWLVYRDLLAVDIKRALPVKFASFTKHEADLFRTLHIGDEVFRQDKVLSEAFDILVWSGSAPMSIDLLAHLVGTSVVDLEVSIGTGVALKVFQKDELRAAYSVHRLVSQVRRTEESLDDRGEWVSQVATRLGDWLQVQREGVNRRSVFENEKTHLSSWRNNLNQDDTAALIKLRWLEAYVPFFQGRAMIAREMLQAADSLAESFGLGDCLLRAHIWIDLAVCELDLGRPSEALIYDQRALDVRIEELSEWHPETATSFDHLGRVYRRLGELDSALECQLKALSIRTKILGERHSETATSLDNLGGVYLAMGKIEQAQAYFGQSLSITRQLVGDGHFETGATLNNMAQTYLELGDLSLAMKYTQESLLIAQVQLGERHPGTATTLSNIALVYARMSEWQESLDCHRQAIDIRSEMLGNGHPDTLSSMRNAAEVLLQMGKPADALTWSKAAWEGRSELFGPQDYRTVQAFRTYLRALTGSGQNREAFRKLSAMLKEMPLGTEDFGKFEEEAAKLWPKIKKPRQPPSLPVSYRESWRRRLH